MSCQDAISLAFLMFAATAIVLAIAPAFFGGWPQDKWRCPSCGRGR